MGYRRWLYVLGMWMCAWLVAPGVEAQTCPSGTYSCGANYCTPNGGVCCASVGRPESYCPSGTTCVASGGCDSGGSSGGTTTGSSSGGGSCPSGSYPCGDSYCTPDGGVCCASVGRPESYCPSGTTCSPGGGCDSGGSTGGTTSGDSGTTGSSGASTGGGSASTGSDISIDGCSDYYDHGYDEYQVQVQCQGAYIYACDGHADGVAATCDILAAWGGNAEANCPYCNGVDPRSSSGSGGSSSGGSSSGDSSSSGACSASPAGASTGALWAGLLGLCAVWMRRRRVQRRVKVRVGRRR